MRTELPLLWLVLLALLSGCGDGADRATGPLDAEDVARNNRGVAMMGRYEYGPAFELFSEVSDRNPGEPDLAVNREIARLNRQEAGDEVIALENLGSEVQDHVEHAGLRGQRGAPVARVGVALHLPINIVRAKPTHDHRYDIGG